MTESLRRQTLGDVLRRTAARQAAKPAIICGETVWTYAEFDAVCTRLAGGLAHGGVRAGDRVAVLARNSHAFAALRFAVARIGAVLVPINFMLKAEEAAFILRHSGARLLCVDAEFAATGRAAALLDTAVVDFIGLPGEERGGAVPGMPSYESLADGRYEAPEPDIDGRSPAQIIYTSGTESLPKGAVLSHETVIWNFVGCLVDAGIERGDLLLHSLPLYHCAQLDAFLGPAVYVGATNVITSRPTPDRLLPLIEQHRISSFFAPPTVWISLLRSPLFDQTDLSSLRKGYYGASAMPLEVLLELQKRLPEVRLWNLYGQTEMGPLTTVLQPEDQVRKAGTVGRAVLNVETRIVDDSGRDVSPGEIGEIVHRSPQALMEYFNDPARTAEAFAGGWFHSGDLGSMDAEGYITVLDRKKDMIKSGGENVASREVEEVIYQLPAVSEVAVVGLPHPRWIEAITAVVVLKAGQMLEEQEVINHCRRSMAHFKAPQRVFFAPELPKNPSGKVLKRELRRKLASSLASRKCDRTFGSLPGEP